MPAKAREQCIACASSCFAPSIAEHTLACMLSCSRCCSCAALWPCMVNCNVHHNARQWQTNTSSLWARTLLLLLADTIPYLGERHQNMSARLPSAAHMPAVSGCHSDKFVYHNVL